MVRLLEAAGHSRRRCTDQSDGDEIECEGSGEAGPLQLDSPCLIGPFEAKLLVDADRFDITGAGGSIGIEVKGEVLAKRTAAMLNVFWFSRKWFQES